MSEKPFVKLNDSDDFFIEIDISKKLNKEKFFSLISKILSKKINVSDKEILKSMRIRENLSTTAFSEGIAFPHIILDSDIHPRIIICKLLYKIKDWKCKDSSAVDTCLFLMISKENTFTDSSIKRMANICKKFADDNFVKTISKCKNSKQIRVLL